MNEINFNIEDIENINFDLGVAVKEIAPSLENLNVIPTREQQIFNHEDSYGYDKVTVEGYTPIVNKKTITENGIYNASDDNLDGYSSVEVATKGSELPLVNTVEDAFSVVSQVLNKVVENYPKILTTSATLYTPNTNFRCYCIQKRNSGKYRILWGPDCYFNASVVSGSIHTYHFSGNNIGPSGLSGSVNGTSLNAVDSGYGYISQEMDTIEDCVNAIQSKNTSYSFWTTNNNFGFKKDEPFIIPASNTVIINKTNDVIECLPSQQISANETIEVI